MNLNQFTIKSQEAVEQAVQIAMQNGQQAIEPAHLLKALILTDENVVSWLFKKLNVNQQRIESALDATIKSFPKVSGGNSYLSNESNQVLVKAQAYLREFGDEFVSVEHILLAMPDGKNQVATLLK